LKIETLNNYRLIPSRIIEEAVWGMLPKGVLGRNYYRRLFVYSDNKINYAKQKTENSIPMEAMEQNNWITVKL
jgi:ribosomal protein L13